MRLAAALVLSVWAVSGAAQGDECVRWAEQGRASLDQGEAVEARIAFETAVEAEPLCASGGELALDGLGQAALASRDTVAAILAWEHALSLLTEETWGRGGDAVAGAYLWALIETGQVRDGRAEVAFDLLLRPTVRQPPATHPYGRLLAQVASVLPDSVRDAAFASADGGVRTSRPLAAWWIGEDPFPATVANERVQEHLLRVRRALVDYSDEASPTGYDARGELLVRFGAPSLAFTLTFDETELVMTMAELALGITPRSFRKNEVWTYEDGDDSRVYVLVGEGRRYRLGQIEDLFPASLRRVIGTGRRQEGLQRLSLLAMQYAYGELATTTVEYGQAWSNASDAFDQMTSPISGGPSQARRVQAEIDRREAVYGRRRAEREGPSRSRIAESTPRVPFRSAAARVLGGGGQTELRLAWRLDTSKDVPADARSLVGTVVCRSGVPERTVEAVYVQSLPLGSTSEDVGPTASDIRAPCVDGLEVQLDLFSQTAGGALGERLATSVWEVGAREPLRGAGLEMSDLWPVEAATEQPILRTDIESGIPLSLYFEAYGFQGSGGRSRAVITYEVIRRQKGSFLRRSREVRSTGELRLIVRGTTTEQYVILDTSDWADADEVEVRVLVRDEQTGGTVERTLTFTVTDSGSQL